MTKNGHLARNAEQARKRNERARARLLAAVAECEVSFAAECAAASTLERVHESAPRFTRDEAIAIVKVALDRVAEDMASDDYSPNSPEWTARVAGARLALEALAAAGVFSDWPCRHETGEVECVGPCRCGTMSDKLDAAEIR